MNPAPIVNRNTPKFRFPFHPAFGEASAVKVQVPPRLYLIDAALIGDSDEPQDEGASKPTQTVHGEALVPLDPNGQLVPRVSPPLDRENGEDGPAPERPRGWRGAGNEPATRGAEFMIYLEFPVQDRPRMSYRVYSRMPVRQLYHAIASVILNCEDRMIRIFVDNQVLLHVGTITDRFFPDFPDVPTVFLTHGCTACVRRMGVGMELLPDLSAVPEGSATTFPVQDTQPSNTSSIGVYSETLGAEPKNDDGPSSRRVSSRRIVPRTRLTDDRVSSSVPVIRRRVSDRWIYDTVIPGTLAESTAVIPFALAGVPASEASSADLRAELWAEDKINSWIGLGQERLAQQRVDAYNQTPQAALGRQSPHDLVHGLGASVCVPPSSTQLTTDGLITVAPGPGDAVGYSHVPLTKPQRRMMVKRFRAEGRHRRMTFKWALQREWEAEVAPAYNQENDRPGAEALMDEDIAFDNFMVERLNRFDSDLEDKKTSFLDDLCYATLPGNLDPEVKMDTGPDVLLMRRTADLWAGLRRVYFGEVEDPSDSEDSGQPSAKKPRTQQAVKDFKREISETRARIRRLDPRVPPELDLPNPNVPRKRDDDHEDGAPPTIPILPSHSRASDYDG
jgi:hypothetical protein